MLILVSEGGAVFFCYLHNFQHQLHSVAAHQRHPELQAEENLLRDRRGNNANDEFLMGELVAQNYRVIRKVLPWQGQMCPGAFKDMESARLKWFNRLEENVLLASETSRSSCRTISSTTSSRGRPYSRRRRRTESRRTSRTS
ncbi:hypothetical protein TrVE_jg733 [Triparma verrucosa]|uniref:Uncharacterized protein n=1 Tax=Triparma verrucosa TaxID=1606542 RepID=A0A9W7B9I4_9STRA|nr:hypothetical protein TrVE_jg733 [Triparma verrucosa]